jgi:hypothetical protein
MSFFSSICSAYLIETGHSSSLLKDTLQIFHRAKRGITLILQRIVKYIRFINSVIFGMIYFPIYDVIMNLTDNSGRA